MKIGFIGLGNLGSAILNNLLSRGYTPVIWNRTKEKTEEFDVPVAEYPKEVIDKSELILINIYDSDAVKDIFHCDEGILQGNLHGKILIDMTTNDHKSVLKFHELMTPREASYLECPVIGTVTPALHGKLTMLVSGEEDPFDEARPLLEEIAEPVIYLKEPGAATKMKLINNLLMARMMSGIAESIGMAEKGGIPRETAIDVLENGAGDCALLKGKKDKLLQEDFSPHFTIKNLNKDLRYAQQLAQDLGVDPLIDVIQLFRQAQDQDLDFSAIYKEVVR